MRTSDVMLREDLLSSCSTPHPEQWWDILPKFGQTRLTKAQHEILEADLQGFPEGFSARRFAELAANQILQPSEACELIQWKYWRFYASEYGFRVEEEMPEVARFFDDARNGRVARLCSPPELKQWALRVRVSLPPEFLDGVKSSEPESGRHKKSEIQQDRAECEQIARGIREREGVMKISEFLKHPKIAPYTRKYKNEKTVRGWLSAWLKKMKEEESMAVGRTTHRAP